MPRTTFLRRFVPFCVAVFLTCAPSLPALGQGCSFAGTLEIGPDMIIQEADPVLGNPSADVVLIEFFDPNCSHCQRFHSVMQGVIEKYGDRVKYYKHPVPVWQYSIRQIEAMFLAKEKGKYYEMIDEQMQNPQEGEMSIEALTGIAELIGIDPQWMRSQLNDQGMRKEVGRASFMARRAGVESTPTLTIGRKIVSSDQPTSCIGRLIERTLLDTPSKEE